ncbi:PEP/pyruvate-binding domain-containing protein [Butyrivibrio sp. XBB1001]|uniref:PEP/pyruvate-binding domain-containing protein n=1 Tax=Butyrivibrio sp. XBB1001 TaxID=1280682 RepID=UPI00040318F4|nr:PEP/pyruvate-binding domain-containing protein [Butyrivibrio sp. XBB1001]
MVVELSDFSEINNKLGNKGKSLIELKKQGFNVPSGFILDTDIYDKTIRESQISIEIDRQLKNLSMSNVREISENIRCLFDKVALSKIVKEKISLLLETDKKYAVRSSASKEDLKGYSFAGQYDTFLNVTTDKIEENIINCYRSMFSENTLKYLLDNNMDAKDLKMSVIVQEMVDSELSGICFTINPQTGKDTEMLIEVSKGLGENIVSGKNRPQQYHYDWYESKQVGEKEKNPLISTEKLKEYAKEFLNIQLFYGYPCDIEFAIKDDELYILQARAITSIKYSGLEANWTTANFKDGGVSARVSRPYMYSLYEYIWEYTLRKYLIDSRILIKDEIDKKLINRFYGRCYWNTSTVKRAMSQVIGYKERDFDNEYGIKGEYEGDGKTTKLTPKTGIKMLRIALGHIKVKKERAKSYDKLKEELLADYYKYKKKYDEHSIKDIKAEYIDITKSAYLKSESTYFWQVFLNTVQEAVFKSQLLKIISESEYLTLLGNLEDVSHMRPFYEIWELSRFIRLDPEAMSVWKDSSDEELLNKFHEKEDKYMKQAAKIIDRYGYHSGRELDVTYPCYYEDPLPVLKMIKDTIGLDDTYSPVSDKEKVEQEYLRILQIIKLKVGERKYKKLYKKIRKMKEMLWWREEYKDISTRYYYLIRCYTMELAKELYKQEVIADEEDIWYLKVQQVWDYLEGHSTKEILSDIISKNKIYYQAYRNYMSDNEIGQEISFDRARYYEDKDARHLKGLGTGCGVVTGTARVIEDIGDIDKLKTGDILITKFTDTGWTPKFAMLSGIITEYGGVLCHAAVVSREYGIPAVVCCYGALDRIRDGQEITIDGTNGIVAY